MANCHELKQIIRVATRPAAANINSSHFLSFEEGFSPKSSCNVYKSTVALLSEFKDLQEGGYQLVCKRPYAFRGKFCQNFDPRPHSFRKTHGICITHNKPQF